MFVTSLDARAWPAERILALSRRRWQAELAFKRLKSLLDLGALRAFDSELVSAWIHAVLLIALLIDLERPSTPNRGVGLSPLVGRRPAVPLWRFVSLIACGIRLAVLASPHFTPTLSPQTLGKLAEPPRRRQILARIS
jgi:hypothetical protein